MLPSKMKRLVHRRPELKHKMHMVRSGSMRRAFGILCKESTEKCGSIRVLAGFGLWSFRAQRLGPNSCWKKSSIAFVSIYASLQGFVRLETIETCEGFGFWVVDLR